MIVIAHRGAGQGFVQPEAPPENTLAAFKQGWDQADACELDVQLTSDGQLIVIHDETTDRTTNASWIVAEHTLDELRGLDAGAWKRPAFAGARLPTLEEVIEALPSGKRLFIELKTGPEIVPKLAEVIAASGRPPGELPIISFDIDSISLAKRTLPRYECYLLVDDPQDPAALVELVQSARLDGIDTSFVHPRELRTRLREAGLKCVVWTVNDSEVAREMADAGVDGITTDIPATLL